jgi:hypothetical protein
VVQLQYNLSLTLALGGWMVSATPRPLYPREQNWYTLYRRLGEPVWKSEENLASTGIPSPNGLSCAPQAKQNSSLCPHSTIYRVKKVCVHLIITIQKVTSNVQSVPRQSPFTDCLAADRQGRGALDSH